MLRRQLLARIPWLAGLSLFSGTASAQTPTSPKKSKILMRSSWGSDDPTRASFPFLHGLLLADAGHDVRIFLTGEATYLMRKATADAVVPVGWPPLADALNKIATKRVPVFS